MVGPCADPGSGADAVQAHTALRRAAAAEMAGAGAPPCESAAGSVDDRGAQTGKVDNQEEEKNKARKIR